THNTLLEVVWTAIPVIILIIIAIPSFKLLYFQERFPETELTLKATGRQWYWSYEYPDHAIAFDARGLWDTAATTDDAARKAAEDARVNWLLNNGDPRRLLETDNRVVVPVGANVRVQITGADVIHAWAVPAFGVKRDAMPGKLNETWFRAEHEGVYYGMCSEICGTGHGYMPIAIEVVSKEKFAAWLADAKQRFASIPQTTLAQR
ncbi:MAG: cytochrome c oxidase subunit II, partial [Alphaproteobacteria bacterium]|nr:cytochrome c oxidase subunit II [Alphaproteobacteria bacterium]